ncbi:CNBP protein, partial [Atractosteus spatula]|nr:CNBP protein [Atractosteus spatula]
SMIVRMFNPHMPEPNIATFLRRFVDVQGGGQKVVDEERIWTFKRRYLVRLRQSQTTPGSVLHPPANFTIGPYRGYLIYPGQPQTCRKCGQEGHLAADCSTEVCRRCGRVGHVATDCSYQQLCNLCGEPGHLGYLIYPGQPQTCRKCGQEGHLAADCSTEVCRRCGRVGHVATDCSYQQLCNLCGEPGHLYRVCPNKTRSFASVVSGKPEQPRASKEQRGPGEQDVYRDDRRGVQDPEATASLRGSIFGPAPGAQDLAEVVKTGHQDLFSNPLLELAASEAPAEDSMDSNWIPVGRKKKKKKRHLEVSDEDGAGSFPIL